MFTFDAKLSTAIEAPQQHRSQRKKRPPSAPGPLSADLLDKMQRYWYAANYLCVGQIYLLDNPLLREPLTKAHIKPRLLGHWGTSAGQNFIYVHLNRLIRETDADIIYISGPGHGGPTLNACAYLEGTYTDVHPEITQDAAGMRLLFRSFSTPGGIPSHCGPHTPNSMHEGGELGYSLVHAFGAAFDNPDLIVACVVGDGEAETCPLEGSWKGVKFLNPARDGAVLPILHLNGYKISGPTVTARMERRRTFGASIEDCGYAPHFVEGDDPAIVHQASGGRAGSLLRAKFARFRRRRGLTAQRAKAILRPWPMIILRTPKGWTCPKEVDGVPIEGTFRAHQVPLSNVCENPAHLKLLEEWMRKYQPEELFDQNGRLIPELAALAPDGNRRMGASPHVNGGRVLKALDLPDFARYALEVPGPGEVVAEAPRKLGEYLRDVIKLNPDEFPVVLPGRDEFEPAECRV